MAFGVGPESGGIKAAIIVACSVWLESLGGFDGDVSMGTTVLEFETETDTSAGVSD
jgi:hypothetical protein